MNRAANKTVIVTGAAKGFGEGIACDMFREGANVVMADLDEANGAALEKKLNAAGNNKALFVKCDVSNESEVENLVNEAVKKFRSLDVFVSNAGVLKAGGLEELKKEDFEFLTKVNYTGFYLCVKHAARAMKEQNQKRPGIMTDIIQINSKSGLRGSHKNFAYAGGKFGAIGLAQSFALELIPYNIKVNVICPGNFFEGPLWMDPKIGLFVQYLKAGKAPGAKTIEDVKNYYEQQTPMKRGCRVEDVMKAIYYLIEQQYETGQALPVTGGQVMLN